MRQHAGAFMRAVLAGVLTASALPFIFALVIVITSIVTGEQTQALITLYVFLIVFGAIAGVIGGISLLIGVPASLVLKRFGWYNRRSHVAIGVVFGFIAFPFFFAVTGEQDAEPFLLLLYVHSALAGGVTADSWWRNTTINHPQEIKPT